MKRKYIWLGVCVTALALAFLIPWIVLLILENTAMKQTEYLEGSGELVSYGELSVARKQQLLAGGELIDSADSSLDAQEQQAFVTQFREEIRSLVECGALPEFMLDLSREDFTVKSYLALHPESNEAFRYYEISNEYNIRCIYDGEQKKILAILMQHLTDLYITYLSEEMTDTMEEALSQQLRGWANYYGHVADEIHTDSFKDVPTEHTVVIHSQFSQGEVGYGFGLYYNTETETLVWGIVAPEQGDAQEAPIQ